MSSLNSFSCLIRSFLMNLSLIATVLHLNTTYRRPNFAFHDLVLLFVYHQPSQQRK